VGRAPGFVLARAEDKVLEEFKATMAALYNLSADEAASLLSTQYGDTERIHSPVQNLALYRDVMVFGKTQLPMWHQQPRTIWPRYFLVQLPTRTSR